VEGSKYPSPNVPKYQISGVSEFKILHVPKFRSPNTPKFQRCRIPTFQQPILWDFASSEHGKFWPANGSQWLAFGEFLRDILAGFSNKFSHVLATCCIPDHQPYGSGASRYLFANATEAVRMLRKTHGIDAKL